MILISDEICLIQNYNSIYICPAGTASRLSQSLKSNPIRLAIHIGLIQIMLCVYWSNNTMMVLHYCMQ